MATAEELEVYINFTHTIEYTWQGPVSDLPAKVRKGVIKNGTLDEDQLQANIDEDALSALAAESGVENDMIELNEIG